MREHSWPSLHFTAWFYLNTRALTASPPRKWLEAAGYEVDDRILKSREEVERFMADNDVETTPLIFIDGEPVGGMTQLEHYLRTADELRS